jgi:hypothetical protein
MDQEELLKSLYNMQDEALKNPDMGSEEAQNRLFDAICNAEKLVYQMEDGLRKETILNYINNVEKPYVSTREKGSNDVYAFCKNILDGWLSSLNENL